MTVGNGISGEVLMPFWVSAGIRMVSEKFYHKKNLKRHISNKS
jgi:hypothetical protein